MARIKIVVIGASAGGVEALMNFVKELPADLPASLFVVLHFPENATSVLPSILSRAGRLRALNPHNDQKIERGMIYVAPPGCHMLVKRGKVRIVRGPKENGHRPAIDPLFRSAARTYESSVAAVILSGMLDDGVIGAKYVRASGGVIFVQDPNDALFPDMPRHALHEIKADFVAPSKALATLLVERICDPPCDDETEEIEMREAGEHLRDPTEMTTEELRNFESHASPSVYTCPECNGTLFELTEQGLRYYRCRVGHSYTPETLEAHQAEELEAAIWEALRALEENLALSKRLLERAREGKREASTKYYAEKVETGARRVGLLRAVVAQTIDTSVSGNGPP